MDLVKKNNIEIKEITQLNMEVFGGCNLACPMCPQGIEDGREKDFKKTSPVDHGSLE